MPTPLPLRHLFVAIALATLPALASAQTPAVTEADYARAERLISYAAQPLVDHAATRLHWLDATHVVYVDHDARATACCSWIPAPARPHRSSNRLRWSLRSTRY